MAVAPTPSEIFERAANEGHRRLDQPLLELASTSFIAGFTIVFGIVALGLAHGAVAPDGGPIGKLVGALAFGLGVVFLIVGRAELFTENFFDPLASVAVRRRAGLARTVLRLWIVTFVLNLVGGGLFALVFAVEGVLPKGTASALSHVASEMAARGPWAAFMSAIVGGALVALLSFTLKGADSVGSRITVAYLVGFLLALGPFDHVIVTTLHIFIGILLGAPVGFGAVAEIMGLATAGNLVGGIGIVTLSHVAQVKGAEHSK